MKKIIIKISNKLSENLSKVNKLEIDQKNKAVKKLFKLLTYDYALKFIDNYNINFKIVLKNKMIEFYYKYTELSDDIKKYYNLIFKEDIDNVEHNSDLDDI